MVIDNEYFGFCESICIKQFPHFGKEKYELVTVAIKALTDYHDQEQKEAVSDYDIAVGAMKKWILENVNHKPLEGV